MKAATMKDKVLQRKVRKPLAFQAMMSSGCCPLSSVWAPEHLCAEDDVKIPPLYIRSATSAGCVHACVYTQPLKRPPNPLNGFCFRLEMPGCNPALFGGINRIAAHGKNPRGKGLGLG